MKGVKLFFSDGSTQVIPNVRNVRNGFKFGKDYVKVMLNDGEDTIMEIPDAIAYKLISLRPPAGTKMAKTAIKHRLSVHGKQNTTSSVHLWHLGVQKNNNLQRIKQHNAATPQKAAA